MRTCIVAFAVFAMQAVVHPRPPALLQIYREAVKPGSEAAYEQIENDTARLCVELGCPHPYLGAELLTGRKEVWFFNGYESAAEQKQVVENYAKNASLTAAMMKNSNRKKPLTEDPFDVVATYRADLSRGPSWTVGQGRFVILTVTKGTPRSDGTVFEAPGGNRFIIRSAGTRSDADALAAAAGPESRVLAVRPRWSFADDSWIAVDRDFWRKE